LRELLQRACDANRARRRGDPLYVHNLDVRSQPGLDGLPGEEPQARGSSGPPRSSTSADPARQTAYDAPQARHHRSGGLLGPGLFWVVASISRVSVDRIEDLAFIVWLATPFLLLAAWIESDGLITPRRKAA
jgi:hypothetical protein